MSDLGTAPGPLRRRRQSRVAVACRLVLVASTVVVLAACSEESGDRPRPDDPGTTADPDAELLFTFDRRELTYDGVKAFRDVAGGSLLARVKRVAGGRVRVTRGPSGRGQAVAFPRGCADRDACPRALLEVEGSARLNPGGRDFAYGATVLLPEGQTTTGSNIVQKGRYGTQGGQWKLQVDTEAGNPSCVVQDESALLSVRSPVTVADGGWHTVQCSKDRRGLTIVVDGESRRRPGRVRTISNADDIRIGSSGLNLGDDQFHGAVDDVFLRFD